MPHKINITNGAARVLTVFLNQQGIFDKTADIFNVGLLLSSGLEKAGARLKFEGTEEQKQELFEAWGSQPYPEFDVTESQRDAIKGAIKKLAEKGALTPNKETLSLFKEFGLAPEESKSE